VIPLLGIYPWEYTLGYNRATFIPMFENILQYPSFAGSPDVPRLIKGLRKYAIHIHNGIKSSQKE
jgi:hypothetical protein